jgi:methylmalonyl-CoA mutase N-terminal domain/subunit
MAERFGAKTDRARALRFHCQTAGMTLQAQQPLNNVVRVTIQALAAVLGGCQSLHTNGYDEALGLPTADAATLALRTQQVIASESGVADFVDALGGSYAIESLTEHIESGARKYIERIDGMGGMVSAIEQGYPQREIQQSAYTYQLEIEQKKRLIVGLNAYETNESAGVPVFRIDPRLEEEQRARVQKVRTRRDPAKWAQALEKIEQAARGRDNLMPFIVEGVKASCTVGEIASVLRRVWGEHTETLVL